MFNNFKFDEKRTLAPKGSGKGRYHKNLSIWLIFLDILFFMTGLTCQISVKIQKNSGPRNLQGWNDAMEMNLLKPQIMNNNIIILLLMYVQIIDEKVWTQQVCTNQNTIKLQFSKLSQGMKTCPKSCKNY